MSNIVIDIAAQFTGKKSFTEADRAAQKLNRTVKNLAGAFGVTFSAAAFVNYSKMAVKAFAEDDKAARTLTKTLNNLGLAFANTEVQDFISDLEKQFGVLDDFLRPAYQKLITTTGDFRKSQDLLRIALDLSAQSGESVVSTSNDLSQALIGNTKGLRKYNLGLTTAQLSAMSFEEVLARITKISKGQAALAADTYSGKLDKLKVAGANASEVLGGALLDSFIKLSGGDIDSATSKIDTFSTTLAKLLRLLTGADSMQELFSKVDFKYGFIPTDRKVSTNRSASPAGTFMRNAAEIKAAAAAKKLADEQAASQKKLLKTQQDLLKLNKAKAIFDLQKIQIEAALKGKISEEDRIRLLLMKAIEDENISQIEKYTKMLDEAQKNTEKLVTTLKGIQPLDDIFKNWNFMGVKEQLASLQSYFNSFAGSAASAFNALNQQQQAALGGYKPFVGASIPSVAATNPSMPSTVGLGTNGTGNQLPTGVTINVNTGIGDPNAIAEAIDNVITEAVSRGTLRGFMIA
jgi:hypothetical protein